MAPAKTVLLPALIFFLGGLESAGAEKVDVNSRLQFGRVLAGSEAEVDFAVAAHAGKSKEVEHLISRHGGRIQFNGADVGYYRLRVPRDRAANILYDPAVAAVTFGYTLSYFNTAEGAEHDLEVRPSENQFDRKFQAQPGSATPTIDLAEYMTSAENSDPLYGFQEIGLPELRSQHPTYDGRGVTVALLEKNVRPNAPELRQSISSSGGAVRKVSGIYVSEALEVFDDLANSALGTNTKIALVRVLTTANGVIEFGGRSIVTPRRGAYLVGFFDEFTVPDRAPDVNADGNPADRPRTFAVAMPVGTRCVYVDTDQDDDLRDERCLGDYNESLETHHFRDREGRKHYAFNIVLTETTSGPGVHILVPSDHSHSVAFLATGSTYPGTHYSGVAPNAQLAVYVTGHNDFSAIENTIVAARRSDIDVIFSGGAETYNGIAVPNLVMNIVYDRVVRDLNKVIVAAAGNETYLTSVIGSAQTVAVIGVGQYGSPHVIQRFFGEWKTGPSPTMNSSRGPGRDGGIKPDVLFPSWFLVPRTMPKALSVERSDLCPALDFGGLRDRRLECANGTSLAFPVAAGSAAILVSAMKQEGLPYTASNIHRALIRTAEVIPGIEIHRQGHGVANLPAALNWLRRYQDREPVEILVEGPVVHLTSSSLHSPNIGRGLFELEGWSPGTKGTRVIQLSRLSGQEAASEYSLELVNDHKGSFSVTSSISLPLNTKIELPVSIHTKDQGVHSALLRVRSKRTGEVEATLGLTVVSSIPLTRSNGFRHKGTVENSIDDATSIYVDVPPDTRALSVEIEGDSYTSAEIRMRGPFGIQQGSHPDRIRVGRLPQAPAAGADSFSAETTGVYRPSSGTWEIQVKGLTGVAQRGAWQLDIRAIPDDLVKEAEPGGVSSATLAQLSEAPLLKQMEWRLIEAKRISGSAVIGARSEIFSITLDVPEDLEQIDGMAYLEDADAKRPITAVLLECQESPCRSRSFQGGRGQAGVIWEKPSPGKWIFNIQPAEQNSVPIKFRYELFLTRSRAIVDLGRSCLDTDALGQSAYAPGYAKFLELVDHSVRQGQRRVAVRPEIPVPEWLNADTIDLPLHRVQVSAGDALGPCQQ